MRKIKLVTPPAGLLEAEVDEDEVNAVFEAIIKQGGKIIKTEYICSRNGLLKRVVVEYEI